MKIETIIYQIHITKQNLKEANDMCDGDEDVYFISNRIYDAIIRLNSLQKRLEQLDSQFDLVAGQKTRQRQDNTNNG